MVTGEEKMRKKGRERERKETQKTFQVV